jgi:hypothetical protein
MCDECGGTLDRPCPYQFSCVNCDTWNIVGVLSGEVGEVDPPKWGAFFSRLY